MNSFPQAKPSQSLTFKSDSQFTYYPTLNFNKGYRAEISRDLINNRIENIDVNILSESSPLAKNYPSFFITPYRRRGTPLSRAVTLFYKNFRRKLERMTPIMDWAARGIIHALPSFIPAAGHYLFCVIIGFTSIYLTAHLILWGAK